MRLLVALSFLFVSALPSLGQTTAPGAQPSPSAPPLFDNLKRDFKGERVIAVAPPDWYIGGGYLMPPARTEPLVKRLQTLTGAFWTSKRSVIPFAVRGSWVIAPETRDEVNLDFSRDDPLDLTERSRLLETALASVTPAQYAQLGSDAGLPVRLLPEEARTMLQHALRPPLNAVLPPPDVGTLRPGPKPKTRTVASVTKPVDIRQVRIRVRLWSAGAAGLPFKRPWMSAGVTSERQPVNRPAPRVVLTVPDAPATIGGVEAPITFLRQVPNKFKPSDLDGARFTRPFGKSGVFTLSQTVAQLQAVTGLKLLPGREWAEWPVYVGSPACTCGDVMDGVRLALRAAWRRVGSVYVLAWDRRGLAALQAMAGRIGSYVREQVRTEAVALPSATRLALGAALPFDPGDPFAWTTAQRRIYFGEPDSGDYDTGPYGVKQPQPISYNEMTERQRSAVDAAYAAGSGTSPNAPADASKVTLIPSVAFDIGLNLPGIGWVYQSPTDFYQAGVGADAYRRDYGLKRWRAELQQRAAERQRRAAEARRNAVPAPMDSSGPDQRLLAPARQRGLAVTAVSREKLDTLLPAMKQKGFTTLYYPAFTGGYACLPTKACPPDPRLKEMADLPTAIRVAKAQGIATVATVDMLAWRPVGAKTHWTDAFNDLLYVDVLGRPLTGIARDQIIRPGWPPMEVIGDTVRPGSPEVSRRLGILMADLARLPGLAGVLLDTWRPEEAVIPEAIRGEGYHERLGYADGDRLAALLRDGIDPLDVDTWNPFGAAFTSTEPGAMPRRPDKQRFYATEDSLAARGPYVDLAVRLIDSLKSTAPGLTRYVRCTQQAMSAYSLGAGAEPSGAILFRPVQTHPGPDAIWVPVASDAVLQEEALTDRQVPFNGATLRNAEVHSYINTRPQPDTAIVYDMRRAPKHTLQAVTEAHITAKGQ